MEAYKLFVRTNREFVQNLESLANAITWFLPERFSNSEIGPEAVYAFLGMVSAVNQHIVDTTPQGPVLPRHQEGFDISRVPWSLLVSILKDAEAVVEVASQHLFGQEGKWGFIAAMEAIKALVRLVAFKESGFKMLLQGGEVVNDGTGLTASAEGSSQDSQLPRGLEGRAVNALNKFGQNAKYNLGTYRPAPVMPAPKPTFSSIWHERGLHGRLYLIGEVVHVLRPVIYVLFIRKCGIKSWTPWLVSLVVDLTGITLVSHATSEGSKRRGRPYQLSESEKDELKRRKNILALYILRDPFFTRYTRSRLEKVDKVLSPVPIVSFFTSKLVELLIGIQTRYTYTAGS
ncbi:Peroxisomal membrane protein PEX16 [Rhynchospora pubera]|uniref:Peroxisomal membrane protein PEX16 n=1 Tax=Rhynchospora pubera TaxID=906938 RepID=A0AAV8FB65_9POAL|nr:Peroxisomal membrane protein PEX16 [Rhynchospora pubera]